MTDPRVGRFVVGHSEMADLVRGKDWSATPLGPMEAWPQSLHTVVSLCLASNFPINIIWGPQHIQIYNDGYRVICGEAHPRALGEDYGVTWQSAWPAIGEPFERALAGDTSFLENQRMFLTRNGYLEETFFTFSTSPIRDGAGNIGGLFHPVAETTATMLAERRTRALRELNAAIERVADLRGLADAAVSTLHRFELDLPFLLFYVADPAGGDYRLAAHFGLQDTASVAHAGQGWMAGWSLDEAVRSPRPSVAFHAVDLPRGGCGPYDEAPARAVLVPAPVPGRARAPVLLVAGVSPRLPLDDAYRDFFELLGATTAGLVGSVLALESERQRVEALAAIAEAKTAFFSNVSHEFRTPLTLLLGPLEELADARDELPPQQARRVEVAHRNALRLLKLVNSLLEFSRIESGRSSAAFQPVQLESLTAEIASSFHSAIDKAGLVLTIETEALAGPVYVDRDMWETVVLNLLSNAFKFTFEGEIRVAVGMSNDGSKAMVSIADTGTGIPASELPRLFERFHRVEGARGRSFEGTGIGLALVQELVRLQAGEVDVESVEGKGSRFRITLPFGRSHLRDDQVRPPTAGGFTPKRSAAAVDEAVRWLAQSAPVPAAPEAVVAAEVDGATVLLVDDNADMRGYVCDLLSAAGIEVLQAADGREALASALRHRPDLILSDVMMPLLDGFGLLAEIRADAALRATAFIMLSARAGQEARVEGLAAGADDYLVKPFSGRELVTRVVSNLKLHRMRREAGIAAAESEARLRAVFDTTYQWQLLMTPEGRVLDANSAALSAAGVAASEVIGKPLWQTPWFAGDAAQQARVRDGIATAADGNPWRHDIEIHGAGIGATPRQFDFSLRPTVDSAYKVTAIVGEALETTQQRRTEGALRQSQKLEAVGRLSGGIAHDFNNLLMVVSGGLSIVARRADAARTEKALEAMRGAVKRGATLTRQMLTFSGRKSLSPRPLVLREALQGIQELLDKGLNDDITVEMDVAPDLFIVEADPAELELAMLNIGFNSRDAMPDGGRITLSATNKGRPDDVTSAIAQYACITVTDTGVGMAPDVLERALEPFFTTKEIGKGTGIGLSQVYGFAKASGGWVTLQSSVGHGTSVSLWLPRSNAEPGALMVPASAVDLGGLRKAHGRVLLVEDDDEVAALVGEMLEEIGYEVFRAASAAGALGALQNGRKLDLVFSDIMMPGGMNGVALAREIRRRRPTLPIVLTSGYAEAFREEIDKEGLHLLPKPYGLGELEHSLRLAMGPALQ